jgi:hypothetical protein
MMGDDKRKIEWDGWETNEGGDEPMTDLPKRVWI